MGVFGDQMHRGVELHHQSIRDFRRREFGKIRPDVDQVLLRRRRPESINFRPHDRGAHGRVRRRYERAGLAQHRAGEFLL